MDWVLFLRWVHVIGATVLLGTGAGIAFFMFMADRTRDPAVIAHVARSVVIGDFIFTTTAVIAQRVSGIALAWLIGWPLSEGWIILSLALYVLTGLFWLPVVWIQVRLRGLAKAAVQAGEPLPPLYHQLFQVWLACGFPAFSAVLAIVWLMLAKPSFRIF
jgi:uncharacterized membrane protein